MEYGNEPIANNCKSTTCYSEFKKKWLKNILPIFVTKNTLGRSLLPDNVHFH